MADAPEESEGDEVMVVSDSDEEAQAGDAALPAGFVYAAAASSVAFGEEEQAEEPEEAEEEDEAAPELDEAQDCPEAFGVDGGQAEDAHARRTGMHQQAAEPFHVLPAVPCSVGSTQCCSSVRQCRRCCACDALQLLCPWASLASSAPRRPFGGARTVLSHYSCSGERVCAWHVRKFLEPMGAPAMHFRHCRSMTPSLSRRRQMEARGHR